VKCVVNLFWRFVFFWKKLTGMIDMREVITITGVVINVEDPDLDADRNFDVELDPGQDEYITGFGRRLTFQRSAGCPSMHCEIPPWMSQSLRDQGAALRVGDRVSITGNWVFDGVHTGRSVILEVVLAVIRHQPNVRNGWFEIHPVTKVEMLT